MDAEFFLNPYVVIVGLMFLVILVYLWSRKNSSTNRKRHQRSFRDAYYDKKKKREKENN